MKLLIGTNKMDSDRPKPKSKVGGKEGGGKEKATLSNFDHARKRLDKPRCYVPHPGVFD